MNLSHLDQQAQNLDLTNEDDRILFRGNVERSVVLTKLSAINEWLDANYRNRREAVRALANQYIKQTIAA